MKEHKWPWVAKTLSKGTHETLMMLSSGLSFEVYVWNDICLKLDLNLSYFLAVSQYLPATLMSNSFDNIMQLILN